MIESSPIYGIMLICYTSAFGAMLGKTASLERRNHLRLLKCENFFPDTKEMHVIFGCTYCSNRRIGHDLVYCSITFEHW